MRNPNTLKQLLVKIVCKYFYVYYYVFYIHWVKVMQMLKKISGYILDVVFILGWGGFYIFSFMGLFNSIIPGTVGHGPKPADINFYIFFVWYISIVFYYSLFFVKYFKDFFIKKVSIKFKLIIFIKCFGLAILMYATLFLLMIISSWLGIAHIETAFWYKS